MIKAATAAFFDGKEDRRYETKELQWYRGRNFSIGRYDVDESNFTLECVKKSL